MFVSLLFYELAARLVTDCSLHFRLVNASVCQGREECGEGKIAFRRIAAQARRHEVALVIRSAELAGENMVKGCYLGRQVTAAVNARVIVATIDCQALFTPDPIATLVCFSRSAFELFHFIPSLSNYMITRFRHVVNKKMQR
jgi:hypothetical protein